MMEFKNHKSKYILIILLIFKISTYSQMILVKIGVEAKGHLISTKANTEAFKNKNLFPLVFGNVSISAVTKGIELELKTCYENTGYRYQFINTFLKSRILTTGIQFIDYSRNFNSLSFIFLVNKKHSKNRSSLFYGIGLFYKTIPSQNLMNQSGFNDKTIIQGSYNPSTSETMTMEMNIMNRKLTNQYGIALNLKSQFKIKKTISLEVGTIAKVAFNNAFESKVALKNQATVNFNNYTYSDNITLRNPICDLSIYLSFPFKIRKSSSKFL